MVRARTPWLAGMSAAACPRSRCGRAGAAAPASTSSTSLLASAASVSARVSVRSVTLLASTSSAGAASWPPAPARPALSGAGKGVSRVTVDRPSPIAA